VGAINACGAAETILSFPVGIELAGTKPWGLACKVGKIACFFVKSGYFVVMFDK
jgi:hypothetical protein